MIYWRKEPEKCRAFGLHLTQGGGKVWWDFILSPPWFFVAVTVWPEFMWRAGWKRIERCSVCKAVIPNDMDACPKC